MNTRDKHANKAVHYLLAFTMEEMRPYTCLTAEIDAEQEACDVAFAVTCHYSEGRDLVEEMVATRFWPIGKDNRPKTTLEKLRFPVFEEEEEGVSSPCFGLKCKEGRTDAEIVGQVEAAAVEILGDISKCEYLARQAIRGTICLI